MFYCFILAINILTNCCSSCDDDINVHVDSAHNALTLDTSWSSTCIDGSTTKKSIFTQKMSESFLRNSEPYSKKRHFWHLMRHCIVTVVTSHKRSLVPSIINIFPSYFLTLITPLLYPQKFSSAPWPYLPLSRVITPWNDHKNERKMTLQNKWYDINIMI